MSWYKLVLEDFCHQRQPSGISINTIHTGLLFHLKSSKYNVHCSMKAQWCLFTSQESMQRMKLSALPATRFYWIRMLAISQMLCTQVKLESYELEHSNPKQKSWVWLAVLTQDIMVSCYCISFFFLLLVHSRGVFLLYNMVFEKKILR